MHPDEFFTIDQQQKLELLMSRWRQAQDAGITLSAEDQHELEALIDDELQGTARRTESVINKLSE